MVNLVAGREVVPELIQSGFTPENVEREVRALLDDGGARQHMSEGLAEVRGKLRGELADIAHSPNAGGCGPPVKGESTARAGGAGDIARCGKCPAQGGIGARSVKLPSIFYTISYITY